MRLNLTSKILALLAVIISFASYKAHASHYAAVDISVQYAGTGPTDLTYKVMVDMYFACEPASAPPSAAGTIYYFSKNEGGNHNTPYTRFGPDPLYDNRSFSCPQVGTEVIVHQLCPQFASQSSCTQTGSSFPGFKLWRCEGTVTLSSRQSDWVFWADWNARNGGILNLVAPGNLFVDAGLDNLTRYDNSTPKFTSNPMPYLCQNESALYLNSPVDPLSDSLVVTNVVPRGDWNGFYGYDAGYSAANPIASAATDPYTVNAHTGVASFTPTQLGFFALAFRVDKYDRKTGKRTGFANRDVQVSVLPCTMLQSPVTGPQNLTASSSYSSSTGILTTYATYNLGFSLSAISQVPNRNLHMISNLPLPQGAVLNFTGNNTDTVTGTFSWTPDTSQIGDHILSVSINDSTCNVTSPIVSKTHKVILLRVLPAPDTSMGINHIAHAREFTISPNPTNDMVNISSELFLSGNYKIDIINSIGQVVYSTRTTHNAQQQLSLGVFSTGIYIIQLTGADGNMYRQKLLKH